MSVRPIVNPLTPSIDSESNPGVVAFDALPAMYVGKDATITGTVWPENAITTVYVNGVYFGEAYANPATGAWSVTGAVTNAMGGYGVTLTARSYNGTTSTTHDVQTPELPAGSPSLWLDTDREVSIDEGSIDGDFTTWTDSKLTPTGTGPYTLTVNGGSASHYVQKSSTDISANHDVEYSIDLISVSGSLDWLRLYVDSGDAIWFQMGTGNFGTTSPSITNATKTALPGGSYRVTFTYATSATNGALRIQPTTGDGTGYTFSDDGATVVVDNISITQSKVSEIADLAGNTNVSQASSGNRPLHLGLGNGVKFNELNDSLSTTGSLSLLRYLHGANGGATIFVAMKRTDTANFATPYATSGLTSGNTGIITRSDPSDYTKYITSVYNGSLPLPYAVSSATKTLGTGKYVHTVAFDTSTMQTRALGEQIGTGALGAAMSTGDPTNQFRLGGGSYTSSNPFGGIIYEVIAYPRKLSGAEIDLVEAYLSGKWGVAFSLSSPLDIDDTDLIIAFIDADTSVTTSLATIDLDPTLWSNPDGATATDNLDGTYTIQNSGAGNQRIFDQVAGEAATGFGELTISIKAGDWSPTVEICPGGVATDTLEFNSSTSVFTPKGNCELVSSSGPDAGGFYTATFRGFNVPASASVVITFTAGGAASQVIVKDISANIQTRVSAVGDQGPNGNAFGQAIPESQPMLVANVVNGHSVFRCNDPAASLNDALSMQVALDQPYDSFLVAKFRSATAPAATERIHDCSATGNTNYIERTTGNALRANAGASINSFFAPLSADDWITHHTRWDGVSSFVTRNGLFVASGDLGTNDPEGFTLGASAALASGGAVDIGAFFAATELTDAERKLINDYFVGEYP